MNKILMIAGAVACAACMVNAQVLPSPAALPGQAANPSVQPSALSGTQSVEEFEVGGLCRTYQRTFFNGSVDALRSYLDSTVELDKGYDVSATKFDAKKVALPGHEYGSATWEGRLNSPCTEEFKFVVTGARGCPFIVTINGKTIQGVGQGTLIVNMVKGINNKVYIANGSPNPITIEYTLLNYAKAKTKTLVPSALKHIVEEDMPDYELK